MIKSAKIILSILLILLSLANVSKGDNDWLYERNKKLYCSYKYSICQANITYNYPFTPMIDGRFLNQAILNPYHYIYLIFDLPKNQTQKSFYLEAVDIKTNETVISNGDCYLINFTGIYEYELRIYKPVYNSLILIKFIGLKPQFFMKVNIKFARDLSIYFHGVMLTDKKSLNKSEINGLNSYNNEQQIINQNKRKSQAIETANKILQNLFGKVLKVDFGYSLNIFTQTIPIPPFLLVTMSISVGYTDSSDNYFIPEDDEIILNKIISNMGVIESNQDCFSNLDVSIEPNNLILKVVNLYNKKIEDILLNMQLDKESFSLTISASPINKYVSFIFTFFDPVTKKNYYEIEIKIQLINLYILEIVLDIQEFLAEALNKAAEFDKKYGKDINIIIVLMILVIIILSIVIILVGNILGVIGAVGASIVVVINEISHIVQSLNFEWPINLFPQLGFAH